MARQPTSTKSSGGGGYTFADKVAAWFLAQILGRRLPLGPDFGPITEIHFETRESGWLVDDLLLTLQHGDVTSRCALSVKSNSQLTENGFPDDFVQDIWEQWRGVEGASFSPSRDILGIVVPKMSAGLRTAWDQMHSQVVTTTPERMARRLEEGSWQASAVQKRIFESIKRPPKQVPGEMPSVVEAVQLLARVRIFDVDFDGQSSTNLSEAINLCSALTIGNTLDDGETLWALLVELAATNRGVGGHLTIPKLLSVLRRKIALKDYPDYESDWSALGLLSSENASRVRRTVGAGIRIDRTNLMNQISTRLIAERRLLIVGESGSGKSAIVAELIGDSNSRKRVLWLNGAQLSHSSHLQLARDLGVSHSLPSLIAVSPVENNILVIDGLEQLNGDAKPRALELVKVATDYDWTIVITCQPQGWPELAKSLVEFQLTLQRFDFPPASPADVISSIQVVPGLGALFLRADLQPILCNLAILDQVVKAQLVHPFSFMRKWVGESDVIDWIWDYWTGSGSKKHARADLLRQLGETDGEKLSGGTPLKSIPSSSLELLREVETDGLLRVTDTAVQFTHDLLADWARLRVLIVADHEATEKIKREAGVPRWMRAIRLYAQRFIEQGSGLTEWKSRLEQLNGEAAEVVNARDLFLDGIIFATNAASLLEQVWSDMMADKGEILQRLLQRLLHAATVPDWRLRGVVDAKHAADVAVWFRIPIPLYWIPLLVVMSRHARDVSTAALIPAAEVCELWLRIMPSELPGRQEAGHIALELAREAQARIAEGGRFSGESSRNVFASLLFASNEFPDAVSEIALELCGRREEPRHAIERAIAAEEEREEQQRDYLRQNPRPARKRKSLPGVSSFRSRGPMRAAATDGPARRVDEAFQSAVLDTPALSTLVSVRPAIAREVLLASCIDEPREMELRSLPMSIDFGLTHWNTAQPEMYFKGPFWSFLKTSPREGLEAILRLVNYATDRWLEAVAGPTLTEADRLKYGLEFPLNDGKAFFWLGNCDVFTWNRHGSMGNEIVVCALMALEKWLYDEVAKGNSIDESVEIIIAEARSLAFAGVLVSVGLNHQWHFTGILRPFLGNMMLYGCQSHLARSESRELWKIQLAYKTGLDPRLIQMLGDWHRMLHRRLPLQDVAQNIMMQHQPTSDFLAARRQLFLASLEGSHPVSEDLRFLLARFDPENYHKTPLPDGKVQVEFRWPEELEKRALVSQQKLEVELTAIQIPYRARESLSNNKPIKPDELESFFSNLQQLATHKTEMPADSERHFDDALAGGIAVLVTQHLAWLNSTPDKKEWCLETLRQLSSNPRLEEYSPNAIYDLSAESFLGEAAVALLTESDEEYLQVLAFNAVTGYYYSSTARTMLAAYRRRDKLGSRFEVLLNVMTLWSALRRAAIREHTYDAKGESLERYRKTLRKRYLTGSIDSTFVPLRRVELLGKSVLERITRRQEGRWRQYRDRGSHREDEIDRDPPPLDVEVLQRGFTFLGEMADSTSQSDVQEFVHYANELFDMEMRAMPQVDAESSGNKELKDTPYSYEHWIWQLAALAITRTKSPDVQRKLWQPVLAWGASAHYWVRDFFSAWFNVGLSCCVDLQAFGRIWREMAEYTFGSGAWNPEGKRFWFHLDDLAVDLMGLRGTNSLGFNDPDSALLRDGRFRPLILEMQETFSRWADKWLKHGTAAKWFAYFLPSESGRTLLVMGIKKLAAVIEHFSARDWDRGDMSMALSATLRACWTHLKPELQSDAELRQCFWSILLVLCGRLDAHALQLRTEIADSLSAV